MPKWSSRPNSIPATSSTSRASQIRKSPESSRAFPIPASSARSRTGSVRVSFSLSGKTVNVPISVAGIAAEVHPEWTKDVNPVIARMGCNMGTCHGAKDGKNGFKLSLRGYDPIYDVRAFTDDMASRRVNLASPDDSLMLLKATAGVPHEGGQRTTTRRTTTTRSSARGSPTARSSKIRRPGSRRSRSSRSTRWCRTSARCSRCASSPPSPTVTPAT